MTKIEEKIFPELIYQETVAQQQRGSKAKKKIMEK